MAPLDGLFKPRSVAVIGASPVAGKPGNNVVRHLLAGGFRGDIWPVNPRGGRIGALDCYASVEDLPGVPDIAFLAVPAGAVEDVLAKCAAAGVGVAVIGASGFAELGSEAGRARQARLAEIARASGMRLLGPNTNGLVSAPEGLALGFNVCFPEATRAPGGVSIVSHSGALFDAVSRRLARSGAGLSRFVAVGNEADITLTEIVAWLATDPATAVIGLIVEALDDGARFRQAAALAARNGKRIVALKVGRTRAGASAALAHSSRMAGSSRTYAALFGEAGVASVGSVEGFAAACALLALTPDWRPAREPLLCVSTSGAGGALVVDAATEHGLPLAGTPDGGWSEPAGRALSALSPPAAVRHPIDLGVLGDWSPLGDVLAALARDEPGPVIAFAHMAPTPAMEANLLRGLVARRQSGDRPVVVLTPGGLTPDLERRYAKAGIPVFHETGSLMEGLAGLYAAGTPPGGVPEPPPRDARRAEAIAARVETARRRGLRVMSEAESSTIFATMGLPMAESHLATSAEEAVAAAGRIGFPVALKGQVPGVAHKAAAGLVALDLADADAVRVAAERMIDRASGQPETSLLVQAMLAPRVEAILAMTRDAKLGPFLLFGLGGTGAEEIDAADMLPVPVTRARLREHLTRSAVGQQVVERLGPHADAAIDGLATVLEALAALAVEQAGTVAAAEVNPMIVTAEGRCIGVDGLIEIPAEGDSP